MIAAITFVILLALLVAGVAGRGSSSTTTTRRRPRPSPSRRRPASKPLFTEIGAAFDAANGSTTTFNFDASGTLQKQIEGGAPVDVFASAAMKQVTALKDAGLVDAATIKKFAATRSC